MLKKAVLLTGLGLMWGIALALAQPLHAQDLGELDGIWEGTLKFVHDPVYTKIEEDAYALRLTIQEDTAKVVVIGTSGDREIKRGKFKVEREFSNAVIFSVDSGRDSDGRWVETWLFSVTLKDKDTLLTGWYRMVNNINLPSDAKDSKFFLAAGGELKRAQP